MLYKNVNKFSKIRDKLRAERIDFFPIQNIAGLSEVVNQNPKLALVGNDFDLALDACEYLKNNTPDITIFYFTTGSYKNMPENVDKLYDIDNYKIDEVYSDIELILKEN